MKRSYIQGLKGCNLVQLTKAFFNEESMRLINQDHHKNRDGILEVSYTWYYDNDYQGEKAWEVYHPGYVRGDIKGNGRTLRIAIDNFLIDWENEFEEME